MLPYGKQFIDDSDISAVCEVLRSDWITQGPLVERFEFALAEFCHARYAVVVSSGTAALHLACIVAGIQSGDEVITSPITFVASANAAAFCGGRPVFADINSDTCNIDVCEIDKKIGSKTRAVIPVHFAGLPCEMEEIFALSRKNGLVVIEDACHALGAEYKMKTSKNDISHRDAERDDWIKVGSCSHSDMTVFSFHPVKHITTGEGGAILTNNRGYYERLLRLRSHGITKDSSHFVGTNSGSRGTWYYEMQELGYNYRITDIQCALGLSQLGKLERFVEKRRAIANRYNQAFARIPQVQLPYESRSSRGAYHLYVLRIDFEKLGKNRAEIMDELRKRGVGTQVHYIPVHMQPYYRRVYSYKEGDFPVAESYYHKALSLPLYPAMTSEDTDSVIDSVKECLNVR